MPLFAKLKSLFARPENEAAPVQPPKEANASEEPTAQASEAEIALLEALSALEIVGQDTLTKNMLAMHVYRFAKPFSGNDLRMLFAGLRWIGYRAYGFQVRTASGEVPCDSWVLFTRMLLEGDVEGASASGSYAGVHVTCTIGQEGVVHFAHDSSRGVSFSAFEELFSPEEVGEE